MVFPSLPLFYSLLQCLIYCFTLQLQLVLLCHITLSFLATLLPIPQLFTYCSVLVASLVASDDYSPLGAWYVRRSAPPLPSLVILAHEINAVYFCVGAQVHFTGNMALPHGNQIISGCS